MKPAVSGLAALGLLIAAMHPPLGWAQSPSLDEASVALAQGGGAQEGREGAAQERPARRPTMGHARLANQENPLIRGEAFLRQARGNLTGVVVTVYGLEPGSTHLAHIHRGSCTGAILFPLNNLVADRRGVASAETPVPAGLNVEEWWVNVHAGYALPSPGITCGKVEAAPAPPAAEERPGPRPRGDEQPGGRQQQPQRGPGDGQRPSGGGD